MPDACSVIEMANRSLRFCLHQGCNRLVSTPYCEEHAPLHAKRIDNRVRADKRGYDNAWRTLRDKYIAAHPLCARCEAKGKTVLAERVHHIIPIQNGGARLDRNNLQSLCFNCHEILHGRKKDTND